MNTMPLLNASPMPARPYSEYTIFFRLERIFILTSMGITDDVVHSGFSPHHFDPIEHPRPQKYTDIKLPPFWYSASHKGEWGMKTRKHRKIPGRIDFKTLSKTISANWRKSDAETNVTKAYCKKLATAGLQFYKVQLDKFRLCGSGCNETNEARNKKSRVPSLSTASDEVVKTGSVESNTISPNQAAIARTSENTPVNAEFAPWDLDEDPLMSDSLCHLDVFGDNNAPQEKQDEMIDIVKRYTTTNRYETSITSVDSANELFSRRIEMQRTLTNRRDSLYLPSHTVNDYQRSFLTELLGIGSYVVAGGHSRSSNVTPEEHKLRTGKPASKGSSPFLCLPCKDVRSAPKSNAAA